MKKVSENIPVSVGTSRSQEAEPYWQGLEQGVVKFQHCRACGQAVFYPRTFCPYCMTEDALEWRTSSGSGTVYTYSELIQPPTEADRDRVPYILGIVEMAEGFYLFGEIVPGEKRVDVGMAVRALAVEGRNGIPLLNFVPAG